MYGEGTWGACTESVYRSLAARPVYTPCPICTPCFIRIYCIFKAYFRSVRREGRYGVVAWEEGCFTACDSDITELKVSLTRMSRYH
jgi:hypothetical protein